MTSIANFTRNVNITVDQSTFPTPLPQEIINLRYQSPRPTNFRAALLHAGLWTRPPFVLGFSLSDFWAWLRYGAAISDYPYLRLKWEWDYIDPHQKTVLSDELGVGFTTQLFTECLGFLLYADTQYVVNILSKNNYYLGKSSKTGPQKSPDYMAIDIYRNVNVLECKGSQTSRTALYKAVVDGVSQKTNLRPTSNGRSIRYCLATGLYIPQYDSQELAEIIVMDPTWESLIALIAELPENIIVIVHE